MSNLTLSIDEQLIKKARIKAIEEGTSLSAKVREMLMQYVQGTRPAVTPTPPTLPLFDGHTGMHAGIDPTSNKSLLAAVESQES